MPTKTVSTITGQDTIAPVGSVERIFGVTGTGAEVALGTATINANNLFGLTVTGVPYPSYVVTDVGSTNAAGGGGAGKPVSLFLAANSTNATTSPLGGTLTAAETTTTVKGNNGGGNAHPGSKVSMTIADVTPTSAQAAVNPPSASGTGADPIIPSPAPMLIDTTQPPIIPA